MSARGSLAIVVDFNPVLELSLCKKGMLGRAAESLAVVSWKDQSLQSCNIHESF